jgi:hypothetical protein
MAKPTIPELVGRIHAAAALLSASYAPATTVAKTYEAYVWTLTIEAVQSAARTGPVSAMVLVG